MRKVIHYATKKTSYNARIRCLIVCLVYIHLTIISEQWCLGQDVDVIKMLTLYHVLLQVFFADRLAADGTTASRGIATDLSILNSAYFVSLVILSLTVGSIVSIAGSVRAYMSTAAVVGAVSCVYIWRVVGDKQALQQLLHPHHISRQSPVSHRLSAN